jgi:hypothetical protein
MKAIRQIIRGCTNLPYVGEHPGTFVMLMLMFMGGLAGSSKGGTVGALGGMALMVVLMLPLFLWGAYDRANLSDHLVEEAKGKA